MSRHEDKEGERKRREPDRTVSTRQNVQKSLLVEHRKKKQY